MTQQEKLTSFKYCDECDNIRPPRATHCRLCGYCVMRADHHCAWMGNCIAYNTHKNFFLFLLYTTMIGYLQSSCYIYGWFNGYYGRFPKDVRAIFALMMTCYVGLGTCVLTAFTVFSIFLIIKNYLSCEMFNGKNVFNQHVFEKPMLENIKEVMGDSIWTWLVPTCAIDRE